QDETERRIGDDRRVRCSPEQRIEHRERWPDEEEETRIGEHVAPEIEEERGAGFLPAPLRLVRVGLDDLGRTLAVGERRWHRGVGHGERVDDARALEQLALEIVYARIFEVA